MRNKDKLQFAIICLCIFTALFSSVKLIGYTVDFFRTRWLNAHLASQYHDEETTTPAEIVTPTSVPEQPGTATPTVTIESTATPVITVQAATVTASPRPTYDPYGGYPDNPYRLISEKFKKLQRTNTDICGWISIGTDLDQAVVQRDNEYYLRRDYTGRHNSNGAIFLEEQINLLQRPSCYILYGHNMKTEAMFGMLHKYDKLAYLQDHPLITFDTQYEEGTFAIFSITTVTLDPNHPRFVDFYNLPLATGETRTSIINRLQKMSDYKISLDVAEKDQLLLLVTCVGSDQERRIVAARRLRNGETESSLRMTYLIAEKKQ